MKGIVADNKKNKLVNGFLPLAILARIFGYFPFSDLKKDLNDQKVRVDVILTLLTLILMIYSTIDYFISWPHFYFSDARDTAQNVFFVAYRISGKLTFLYFACYQNRALVRLFRDANRVASVDDQQTACSWKKLSWILALISVVNCMAYVITTDCLFQERAPHHCLPERIVINLGILGTIFSYNFISTFLVFFSYFFKWQLRALTTNLREGLRHPNCHTLWAVRVRHESMVTLIERFNSILSPISVIYIAGESVAVCVNFYELCLAFLQPLEEIKTITFIVKSFVFIFVRLGPLLLVCAASTSLVKEAESCVTPLDSLPLTRMSSDFEFQTIMLFEQFQRRKVEICVFKFLAINNNLLAKISGIIITYVLFMMQTDVKN